MRSRGHLEPARSGTSESVPRAEGVTMQPALEVGLRERLAGLQRGRSKTVGGSSTETCLTVCHHRQRTRRTQVRPAVPRTPNMRRARKGRDFACRC